MAHEFFQYIIKKYGEPNPSGPLDAAELSMLSAFPAHLVEFYKTYGRCVLREGRLQLCHPSDLRGVMALILGADKDFSHHNCQAFAYSAFGNLYAWGGSMGLVDINLLTGKVFCDVLTKGAKEGDIIDNEVFVPFSLDDEAHDLVDLEGKLLFSRVVKKYGSLEIGECYGFVPALALGGLQDIEFVRRLKAPEHFAIIAQTVDFNLIDVECYGRTKIVRPIG